MLTPAIAYIRVSTDEQAREGVSLAAQRERVAAYSAAAGLKLVAIFEDAAVSGSTQFRSRLGGARLLVELKRSAVRNVVAVKLDRLFRDTIDALEQTRDWDQRHIALHLIDFGGQALNTGTALGRLFFTVAAGFAEVERNLTRERTAAALQHLKGQRRVYGPVPFGFTRKGEILVPSRDEQRVLRTIAQLRRGGASTRQIAARLNARRVPTKRGRKWWPATVGYMLRHACVVPHRGVS